jgi:site-specific DNA recombinase
VDRNGLRRRTPFGQHSGAGIDTSTASGRLFRNILASFAEFERDSIVERTSRGLRVRARKGQWAGGPPPYGYHLTPGGLEEDPIEAAVVRRIFADFVRCFLI